MGHIVGADKKGLSIEWGIKLLPHCRRTGIRIVEGEGSYVEVIPYDGKLCWEM